MRHSYLEVPLAIVFSTALAGASFGAVTLRPQLCDPAQDYYLLRRTGQSVVGSVNSALGDLTDGNRFLVSASNDLAQTQNPDDYQWIADLIDSADQATLPYTMRDNALTRSISILDYFQYYRWSDVCPMYQDLFEVRNALQGVLNDIQGAELAVQEASLDTQDWGSSDDPAKRNTASALEEALGSIQTARGQIGDSLAGIDSAFQAMCAACLDSGN